MHVNVERANEISELRHEACLEYCKQVCRSFYNYALVIINNKQYQWFLLLQLINIVVVTGVNVVCIFIENASEKKSKFYVQREYIREIPTFKYLKDDVGQYILSVHDKARHQITVARKSLGVSQLYICSKIPLYIGAHDFCVLHGCELFLL